MPDRPAEWAEQTREAGSALAERLRRAPRDRGTGGSPGGRGGGVVRPASPVRVKIRNRLWRGMQTVTLVDGVHERVDAAALRAALRRLYAIAPTARALCRVDQYGHRLYWSPVRGEDLEEWLERLVVDDPAALRGAPGDVAERLLRQPCDERPFVVTVQAGRMAWRINHILADGHYAMRHVIAVLVRAAAEGGVPAELLPPTDSAGQRPLLTAAWTTFVREPRLATWRTALRHRAQRRSSGPRRQVHTPETATALSVVLREGGPGVGQALRAWGQANAPGVSSTVLIMAAARRALEREGVVDPDVDSVVMYDLRRYLPRTASVEGNFSAALRLTDPSCRNVRRMAEQIAEDIDLGLPLISLLAAEMDEGLAPVRSALVGSACRREAVGPVVLTHLGSMAALRAVPWDLRSPRRLAISAAAPSAPSGITVCTGEWAKGLQVTCSFDGRIFPAERVAAAATLLTEKPWDLLEDAID